MEFVFIDTKELFKEFKEFYENNFYKENDSKIDKEYMECKFTKYRFNDDVTGGKKSSGFRRSIWSYFSQIDEDNFFILMNRNIIKKLYEKEKMSSREILNFLYKNNKIKDSDKKKNFLTLINKTDTKIIARGRSESLKIAAKKIKNTTNNNTKSKLIECGFDINNLSNKEIIKINRSYLLSPFKFRKAGLDWNIIEQKNMCEYDECSRKFVDEFVLTGNYNFYQFFREKSKTDILLLSRNVIMKILGKKIFKYFGYEKILNELKTFYEKVENKNRYIKFKHHTKISSYFGYIDGRNVSSLSEAKLTAILLDNGIDVITNSSYDASNKFMYDLYLPRYNIYIEYLGLMNNEKYFNNVIEKKNFFNENKYDVICSENIDEIFDILEKKLNIKIKREILHPIIIAR